ncbi:copper resistance protein CopC [Oxalobacteraceae bacterium CAVE-383]|nr:copper resistance protein CopC [Oxalobacteraceae bacterium CAVE-383]
MILICIRMLAAALRPAGRRLARGLLLFGLLQLAAGGAFAHASLLDTAPADGAMLRAAPAGVTLHFNEPVAPLVFKLALPDGSVQPLTQVAAIDDGLKLSLPDTGAGADGTYLLSWRVVSADGHPVGGSLTYSIGARSGANAMAQASAATMPPSLMAAIWSVRLALYLSLFIGVGAAVFRAFVKEDLAGPGEFSWRWAAGVSVAALLLLPLAVGLQGLDALALPWNALGTWAPWRASLATAYGLTAWRMAGAAIAACIAIGVAGKPLRRISAAAAVVLLGAALAASGHASSAAPQWLARPAVFLHGMTIAIWVGSLLPLLLLLRERAESGGRIAVLLRFSRMIPWVLALLLASGATLAWLQLDGVASLWRTDYGRILSAKLILALLLLLVAAVNRYALTGRVQREVQTDHRAARARLWMRRLICVELGLVLLILALATTWRFTPPPRALAPVHPAPVNIHIHGEKAMVDLSLKPQPDRRLLAALFVQAADFSPLDAKEISLQFSNPALGIEPLQKDAHRGIDNGSWTVDPFALPAPGRWHVRIDVLISDFETTSLEQDVNIAF